MAAVTVDNILSDLPLGFASLVLRPASSSPDSAVPQTSISPASGLSRPPARCRSVDLPEPDS
ncbi:MAG: hypothetical protein ACK4K6_19155, partial [Pseudarthrobacter sp.]